MLKGLDGLIALAISGERSRGRKLRGPQEIRCKQLRH